MMVFNASTFVRNPESLSAWQFLISFLISRQIFHFVVATSHCSQHFSNSFCRGDNDSGCSFSYCGSLISEDWFLFIGKVGDQYLKGDVPLDVLNNTVRATFHVFPGMVPRCDEDLAFLFRLCHYHDLTEWRKINPLLWIKFWNRHVPYVLETLIFPESRCSLIVVLRIAKWPGLLTRLLASWNVFSCRYTERICRKNRIRIWLVEQTVRTPWRSETPLIDTRKDVILASRRFAIVCRLRHDFWLP